MLSLGRITLLKDQKATFARLESFQFKSRGETIRRRLHVLDDTATGLLCEAT